MIVWIMVRPHTPLRGRSERDRIRPKVASRRLRLGAAIMWRIEPIDPCIDMAWPVGPSARREQSPLPALAGFEFIAEDIATHDGSLSTLT